jgi:hypothetical protein
VLLQKIRIRFARPSFRLLFARTRGRPIEWKIKAIHVSPRALLLLIFGAIFLTSATFDLQSDLQPDNRNALPAPIILLTPESFAIAPAAPTRASSTREPNNALTSNKAVSEDSLFDVLIQPLANEAQRRRAEMARRDPEFLSRMDSALNVGRINFLLYGYGETHEPPFTEKALIGSYTIISYDLRTRQADIISFTHDIRAPEIERELIKRGVKPAAMRMDNAYPVGGFQLMRQMLEDATGLSIDFQIAFKDTALRRLIDNVFDGVTVDVPMDFDVHPFYLDDVRYAGGHFAQGTQKLDGLQVIQFIKTVPVAEGEYDKAIEHNARKAYVFEGLLKSLDDQYADRGFWLRGAAFVAGEFVNGSLACDFDPIALIVNNIGSATASLTRARSADSSPLHFPKIAQTKYIVDAAQGDGGVQWVNANAAENPITQRDIDAGTYATLAMEVPLSANPYGDLVTGYWGSVRALVRDTLKR